MAPKIFVDYDEEIIDENFNYQEVYDDLDNSITQMPALEPDDYQLSTIDPANVDSVRSFNHFSFTTTLSQYQIALEVEALVWACQNFGNYLKQREIVHKGTILLQENFYVNITIELNTIIANQQSEAAKILCTKLPFSQNDHRFNRELLHLISSNMSSLSISISTNIKNNKKSTKSRQNRALSVAFVQKTNKIRIKGASNKKLHFKTKYLCR